MVNDELFDGVVLTMPIPQVLQLGGDVPKVIDFFFKSEMKRCPTGQTANRSQPFESLRLSSSF